jgi:hypothetical protein
VAILGTGREAYSFRSWPYDHLSDHRRRLDLALCRISPFSDVDISNSLGPDLSIALAGMITGVFRRSGVPVESSLSHMGQDRPIPHFGATSVLTLIASKKADIADV